MPSFRAFRKKIDVLGAAIHKEDADLWVKGFIIGLSTHPGTGVDGASGRG